MSWMKMVHYFITKQNGLTGSLDNEVDGTGV
jgi:hypothetical protein